MHEYLNRDSRIADCLFDTSIISTPKQHQGNHDDGFLAAVFGVFFFGCMQESLKRALRDKKKWVIMFFVNLSNNRVTIETVNTGGV